MATKTKKKARQTAFDGMKREVDKEVAAAAEAYVTERDKRMKKSKDESEAKIALIEVMKKKGLDVYRDDEADPPVVITLSNKTNVKVTEVDDEPEATDEPQEAQPN